MNPQGQNGVTFVNVFPRVPEEYPRAVGIRLLKCRVYYIAGLKVSADAKWAGQMGPTLGCDPCGPIGTKYL